MDDVLYYLKYGAVIALVIVTIIKLLATTLLSNNRIESFFVSFLKWYEKHQIYETTSGNRQQFMKYSNMINIVWWPCLVMVLLFFVFFKDVLPF